MISRILLAVDDSPAALAAAEVAFDLAHRLGSTVLAVNVSRDHILSDLLAEQSGRPDVARRREFAAASVLGHIAHLGDRAGVLVETRLLEGDVAHHVLEQAGKWNADLIVIGKSGQRGPGEPYVGSATAHVLEFAEQPVLVVPAS